jgi:uncharacterized protein YndB with AHSA1/START domain
MAQWTPPTGFTMSFIQINVKPEGGSFYKMTNEKNVTMYGRANYLKIKSPDRLVYTQQFCTEDEKISRHPMAPTWPETMLTTVQLTEEEPRRTRVTITWEPYGKVSREELAVFLQARAGMTQGWTGSFDKLEAYLEK